MALSIRFLTNIRGFLKNRDGNGLRDWLLVEPPVPDEYHNLTNELKSGYRNATAVEKLVEQCLPIDDSVSENQGTSWGGFISFMKDYFEYWRDVDFDDLLGAHQMLTGLTNSCASALTHPTYGSILLQTSMSLCASLSKLSMTLNKRSDLTRKLRAMGAGDEDQKSVVEHTAEIIQKIFTTCLTDRSSPQYAKPEGKKIGVYIFANLTLKLLFACRKQNLAKQLFTNITSKSPPLSYYPAAQRVTYLYYLGRFHFMNNHFNRASRCLQEAYNQTPSSFQKHRRLILVHLIPSNIFLGRLPSRALLQRPEAQSIAQMFIQISQAVRTGNFLILQQTLEEYEPFLFRNGLLLYMNLRLRPLIWRSFSRRTFLLTYIASTEADSKKAATLELSHLLTTSNYVQKLLEGYSSTLAPPAGGAPKPLRPNEGLIHGNMCVTQKHVEGIVASLVAQGFLAGYMAHSLGRFAIRGAKQKGNAVAAGWPPVVEVTVDDDNEVVPGLVRND